MIESVVDGATARRAGAKIGRMTSTPPTPLPDDPAALKAMVRDLVRAREEDAAARVVLARRVDDLQFKSLRLEMELFRYKKWVYGPRADRLTTIEQVNQMLLSFGADLDQRPSGLSVAAFCA